MADSDEEYESKRERNKFRNERYEESPSGSKSTSDHSFNKHSNKRYMDSDPEFHSNKYMKGYDMSTNYHRYPRQDDQPYNGRSYNYYHDHKKKTQYSSNGNGNRDRRTEMMFNRNNQLDYMEMNPNFSQRNYVYDQHLEQSSKRFCAENWNMFGETGYDGPQSYFEHDNRFDPGYDQSKEFNNRSNRASYVNEYNRFGNQSGEYNYSNNGHFTKHKPQRFNNFNQMPAQTNPYPYFDNGQSNFYNNNDNHQQYPNRNYPFTNAQFSHPQHQAMTPMYQQYPNESYQQHIHFNSNGSNTNGNNNYNDEQTNYLMTFRHFLNTLPNRQSTPHDVANKMYNDYRNNYRKEQNERFFAAHKHEDWFRIRYHPEESAKRKQEQNKSVRNRLDIFMHLMAKFNYLNEPDSGKCGLSLKMSSQEARLCLLKFLDACMIRLEGGQDSDLAVLDQVYKSESNERSESEPKEAEPNGAQKEENEQAEEKKEEGEESKSVPKENETTIEIVQRTKSIFFKHLPVIVTKQDLENIGKKYDGFKRAAISEPAPDRRFQRRGWITFDNSVNIKDLCAKINGTKLYNMNLIVSVNRDFDDRIKQISALANHSKIVRNDLKLIIRIVNNMDKRWNLWAHQNQNESNQNDKEVELKHNPLLKEAEEYLQSLTSEECESAEHQQSENKVDHKEEQEEISKDNGEEMRKENDEKIEEKEGEIIQESNEEDKTDDKVNKEKQSVAKTISFYQDLKAEYLLDKLILYLRIVHSIDFYSASEYQQEDNMPNRCGVLHVRTSSGDKSPNNLVNILNGPNVSKAFDADYLSQEQLDEWIRLFEVHVKSFVEYVDQIDLDLAKKLGLKEASIEIEKFIAANCKQIEKNVWLCPLSGKKFKGADYVRKHIESKFTDKLDEVRGEVDYFNRFILDPKRPFLPEFPPNNSNRNNQQHSQFANNRSNGFNHSKH